MRDQEFVDLSAAYNQICEQIKIPVGKTAEDVLQKMIPPGEKVKKIKAVKEAKDETEEGITGQPIPKRKLGPKKRHEFEKKRRAARKERGDDRVGDTFSRHRMTGSRGHGSENVANPRVSYRHNEEYLIDYLIDEGFASDEKSAEAIMGVMSEEWMQTIIEGMGLSVGASKLAGKLLSNPRTTPEQGARNFQRNLADPVGHAVKGAARAVLGVGDKKNDAMMQKRRPN